MSNDHISVMSQKDIPVIYYRNFPGRKKKKNDKIISYRKKRQHSSYLEIYRDKKKEKKEERHTHREREREREKEIKTRILHKTS